MGGPVIRQAAEADVPSLVRALDQAAYFTERLRLQGEGHGRLLVAWDADVPVGDVYVWLGAPEEPELRARLTDVGLITHLEVAPRRRNRRIGSALLDAAERAIWDEGRKLAVLGVGLDNEHAAGLYLRRGYVEWEHGLLSTTRVEYRPDGSREIRPEVCRVMVKPLHLGP
ncbi:GNAT family N-acetyltransferase [Microbispora sp. RL4-1S]|uniref:GNAT family N-acetyltransferase n=1 Tax=Microbispora oryzae TaxID=2806554 RepID=A0A940WJT1_9ACTN|nr:GNAT family N-acetyltransferase [Microbispora oryzae]MBP2706268.1 GNAT family N-acetyltransferase [Microbispora oryzae]